MQNRTTNNANENIARIRSELSAKYASTTNQETAIENLYAETKNPKEATSEKLRFIKGHFEFLAKQEFIRNAGLIYAASGTDIELALLLGAKKISLIDPAFKTKSMRSQLEDKIAMFDENLNANNLEINFKYEFTEGETSVNVKIIPTAMENYVPEQLFGAYLEWITPQNDLVNIISLVNNLVTGGYIIKPHGKKPANSLRYGLRDVSKNGKPHVIYQKTIDHPEIRANIREDSERFI